MIVQINGHSHADVDSRKITWMQTALGEEFARFADQISRVEVHFSDENGVDRKGSDDIRCLMEVRLNGKQPINVESRRDSVENAFREAASAMLRRMESLHGKEISVKRKSQRDSSPKGNH